MALPRFEWASQMAGRNRATLGITGEPDTNFIQVREFAEEMLGDLTCTVAIEWISTHRQFARVIHKGDESALLFDLAQAKVLRRLWTLLDPSQESMDFFKTIKEAVVLSLCANEPGRALALSEIDYEDLGWLDSETQSLGPACMHFAEIAQFAQAPDIIELLDLCLIAHEVQHVNHRRGFRGGLTDDAAKNAFERALPLVYYQDSPDFEMRITHGGTLDFDRKGIEGIRTDLIEREAYARANRTALIDEIACDLFAYYCFEYCLGRARNEIDIYTVADCFLLWFKVHDLHRAMIDRAEIAPKLTAGSRPPPNIADMGLRSTALLCGIHELIKSRMGSDNSEASEAIWRGLINGADATKLAFDAFYHRPIVRILLHQSEIAAANSAAAKDVSFDRIVNPAVLFGT